MKNYYHFCFTCPKCHEPYRTSSTSVLSQLVFLENGNLICSNCSTEFHPFVNFSEKYPTVIKFITETGNPPFLSDLEHVPLCWNVDLNSIECDYLKWILEDPEGVFLITWPWPQVRFIPIVLTEYCLTKNDTKVVVIGDFEVSSEDNKIISSYTISDILNKTFFIDDPQPYPEVLKKELVDLKNKKSLLFDQHNVIIERSRRFGNGVIKEQIHSDTLNKCINTVKKEAIEYGSGYLRSITKKKKNGQESKGFNENDIENQIVDPNNGQWDVTLTEQTQWSGELYYNIRWLCEVLANKKKVTMCSDIVGPARYLSTDNHTVCPSATVHLISSSLDPKRIFSLVQEISPTVVIIENTDFLMKDVRSTKYSSRELLEYLKCPAKTVLLFSTNPEWRQFYNLEREESIFSSIPITIHTLDSSHVMSQFSEESIESRFPNPLSSMMKDAIIDRRKKINAKYIKSEILTDLFNSLVSIPDSVGGDFARDIRFYIRKVLSSPLNIIGNYSDFCYLCARRVNGGQSITYDAIYSDLCEYADSGKIPCEIPEIFHTSFRSIYLPEGVSRNPLREKYFESAKEILERDPYAHIIFIINFQEIKGLNFLLKQSGAFSDDQISRIDISSWGGLHDFELKNKKSKDSLGHEKKYEIFIISSQYPSLNYNLRESSIKEFIFICDCEGIAKIQEIIDSRLLERFSFPVVQPKDNWNLPEFLKEAIKNTPLPPIRRIEEIYEGIDDEVFQSSNYFGGNRDFHMNSCAAGSQKGITIDAGEEVFVCIDFMDRAVFIPIGKSVMIRKGDFFEDITLDNELSNKKFEKQLYHQEIIMNKSGLVLSLREIFFGFMMRYGSQIKFKKWHYDWDGYENLFSDSILWIQLIEKAIDTYREKSPKDARNAEVRVLTKIIESGTTARETGTVSGWLKNYDEVKINAFCYRLYRTEHPFRREDLHLINEVLSDLLNSNDLQNVDPDRIFAAALCLQDFRRKVFQNSSNEAPSIYAVRSRLKKEIINSLQDTEVFSPISIQKITLTKPVESMKIIQEYQHFLYRMIIP